MASDTIAQTIKQLKDDPFEGKARNLLVRSFENKGKKHFDFGYDHFYPLSKEVFQHIRDDEPKRISEVVTRSHDIEESRPKWIHSPHISVRVEGNDFSIQPSDNWKDDARASLEAMDRICTIFRQSKERVDESRLLELRLAMDKVMTDFQYEKSTNLRFRISDFANRWILRRQGEMEEIKTLYRIVRSGLEKIKPQEKQAKDIDQLREDPFERQVRENLVASFKKKAASLKDIKYTKFYESDFKNLYPFSDEVLQHIIKGRKD